MSLHRSCCACEGNDYCSVCDVSAFTITGIEGSLELAADCAVGGTWTAGTDISYPLPTSLAVSADPDLACTYVGSTRWTTYSRDLTFCPPGDYPEGCTADPEMTCEWELRVRTCATLVGVEALSVAWYVRIWVEMEQRKVGGDWTTCHDYTDDPDLANLYPKAEYRDETDPIPECPPTDTDFPLLTDNDSVLTGNGGCNSGDSCPVDCGEGIGSYVIPPPAWVYQQPIGWAANIQLT